MCLKYVGLTELCCYLKRFFQTCALLKYGKKYMSWCHIPRNHGPVPGWNEFHYSLTWSVSLACRDPPRHYNEKNMVDREVKDGERESGGKACLVAHAGWQQPDDVHYLAPLLGCFLTHFTPCSETTLTTDYLITELPLRSQTGEWLSHLTEVPCLRSVPTSASHDLSHEDEPGRKATVSWLHFILFTRINSVWSLSH